MGYQYRGTLRDVAPEPVEADGFDYSKCGTYAGYKQHTNRGVLPCQACKDAQNAYQRERRGLPTPAPRVKGYDPGKCGSYAGYCQHRRYEVPTCEACLEAYRVYYREWSARKAVAA